MKKEYIRLTETDYSGTFPPKVIAYFESGGPTEILAFLDDLQIYGPFRGSYRTEWVTLPIYLAVNDFAREQHLDLRQKALNKLTPEEKTLLGLI